MPRQGKKGNCLSGFGGAAFLSTAWGTACDGPPATGHVSAYTAGAPQVKLAAVALAIKLTAGSCKRCHRPSCHFHEHQGQPPGALGARLDITCRRTFILSNLVRTLKYGSPQILYITISISHTREACGQWKVINQDVTQSGVHRVKP